MRLTTINTMNLRPGIVHSYGVTTRTRSGSVAPPISFDQRQHCARGPRPGSWMAVSFSLPRAATLSQISTAYHHLIAHHGTMQTVVVNPADPRLEVVNVCQGNWHPETGGMDGDEQFDPRPILREVFDRCCNPFASPSHQLCVVDHRAGTAQATRVGEPMEDATVIIGFDHSHTDAWSLLVTIRDFTALLDAVISGTDPATVLTPTLGFGDHSRQLVERNGAPEHVVARWHEHLADGTMPVFPGDLGDLSEPRSQVVDVVDIFDANELIAFDDASAAQDMSMLGLAVAAMAPVKAVFPIHSRRQPLTPAETWDNAMGWFITNSILDCPDVGAEPGHADVSHAAAARSIMDAIRETIQLGSYPLAPIMEPWGGNVPATKGMFAISWLDNRKLPVDIEPGLEPQHISAEIKTDGVMAWFVSNDDGMHLRVRYPDTPEARQSVPAWCRKVVATMRAEVQGSVGAGLPVTVCAPAATLAGSKPDPEPASA
ncbi:peptide synthetase [Corynebacterium falsenii DSM 44353]|uniref:hypothetical protein n=1 Tax=Corynebacterium falsenii TaxID=108486 RepID=UPI0003E93403|nr:hypothetical protein [Corynebacterium falsenii]AHI04108.1 peptide synthetase [Corynebacterium falsenii DSM 44353]UBI04901.1 hypothetical protein LA343_01630 [Corynebacterium falsenii]